MKRILSIVLSLAMAFAATGSFGQAEMLKQKEPVLAAVSEASWNHGYDTLAEMTEGSDLILRGTVLSSQTELRHDLVFTRFTVSVDQLFSGGDPGLERVEILQTGGSYEEEYTPAINGAPLLRQGEEYLLYLEYAETEQYGNYYLIAGANQGVAQIAENSSEASPFSMAGEQLSLIPYGTDEVIFGEIFRETSNVCNCYNQFVWREDGVDCLNLTYFVSFSSGTTSLQNNVIDGFTYWDNYISQLSFSRIYSASSAKLRVYMMSYGTTGWDGLTTITYRNNQGDTVTTNGIPLSATQGQPIYKAGINLNTDSFSVSYLSNWKAVAAHEMGHALGLHHHEAFGCPITNSIMLTYTDDYYSNSILLPTNIDILNIQAYYEAATLL